MNKEQGQQLKRIIQVADEAQEALNIRRYSFSLPADLMDAVRKLPYEVIPWNELDDERVARIIHAYLSGLPDEVKKEAGVRHYDDPTTTLKLAIKTTRIKLKNEGIDLSAPLSRRKKPKGSRHVH
ncbi:hypothetical protein [Halomonas sp. GT]|uniref:hypothetical protein n=1 Tax=Halomonas sp. GT TaxID=1971364 RepID=UPI0009F28B7D|nr:hypothetical protein [Halomonas sp. GT]